MLLQHSASPLPNTSQIRLATELSTLVANRDWMPVLETHVGPLKIDEEITRLETSICARGTGRQVRRWWRFVNTIVDQMAIGF